MHSRWNANCRSPPRAFLYMYSFHCHMLKPDSPEHVSGPAAFPAMQDLARRVGPRMMMDVGREALRLMLPRKQDVQVIGENGAAINMPVTRKGMGPLETDFGRFWHARFDTGDQWGDYHALIACNEIDMATGLPKFSADQPLLVRTDSGCITGQVFHDKTCDCRQQLHQAMAEVSQKGEGIIVHIPGQDGRGMGLDFKLATLHIQERLGADTVQAACIIRFMTEVHESINALSRLAEFDQIIDITHRAMDVEETAERLWDEGHAAEAMNLLDSVKADIANIVEETRRQLKIADIDQRTYEGVIAIIKTVGVQPGRNITMATNNPQKLSVFERNGFAIKNTPIIASNSSSIARHLNAKAAHLGHVIPPYEIPPEATFN